ncbi:MAG: hypothetical protein ACJ8C4_12730 [Gemmataceae bacterium]
MMRHIRLAAAIVALVMTAQSSKADTCYVVVFGAVSKPQRARYSHSWATFVRVPGCPAGARPGNGAPMETFTISWYAQSEELRPLRLFAECGRNLDLPETFRIVLSHCELVSAWGPFEIDPELYQMARCHKNRLESGEIRYKTIDWVRNPNRTSNCIHALTAFNTAERRVYVGRTNFGQVASYDVVKNYDYWMINPCQTHPWIADLLCLNQWPVRWRTLDEGRPRPRMEP